jgi:hypothetical protein
MEGLEKTESTREVINKDENLHPNTLSKHPPK